MSSVAAVGKPLKGLGDVLAMALDALVILFTKPFSWRERHLGLRE